MDFLESYGPLDEDGNIPNPIPLHVFLKTSDNLSRRDLASIVLSAFLMGYREETTTSIETDDFIAYIQKGDYAQLETFLGRQYTAQVITNKGINDISFLLHEPAKARWN